MRAWRFVQANWFDLGWTTAMLELAAFIAFK